MIELYDHINAPERARPTLAAVNEANGFIPNMFRALANAPSTLNGFASMVEANDGGTLSPLERQIVQLVASIENRGAYCVAGHSSFASAMGLPTEPIRAIREGRPIQDKRLQALVEFTRALVRRRGHVTEEEKAAFEAVGFADAHKLEVITGIALKTVTNYVSTAFDLPLDDEFQSQAWAETDMVTAREVETVAS